MESQKELYETLTMQNALKELRQTSSFTGAYTNIDDAEIDNADDGTTPASLLGEIPDLPPGGPSFSQDAEKGGNPNHDPKNGRFTKGSGSGGSTKTKSRGIIPYDTHGKKFEKPQRKLPLKEYRKVLSEIDTAYSKDRRFKGQEIGCITTNPTDSKPAYDYWFEIHEHDDGEVDFNIFAKRRNKN